MKSAKVLSVKREIKVMSREFMTCQDAKWKSHQKQWCTPDLCHTSVT